MHAPTEPFFFFFFEKKTKLKKTAQAARAGCGVESRNSCERDDEFSAVVTTVVMPGNDDADRFRALVLDWFTCRSAPGLAA